MKAATGVLKLVRESVAARGPISFAEYMQLALYSDPGGYYRRNVPGRGGDYLTSPSLSAVFGRLVARQIEEMWEGLGKPQRFRVTEFGAGGADLAQSVLEALPPPLSSIARWCFVEPLSSVEAFQRDAMTSGPRPYQTGWVADLDELEPADGVLIANEVLDNHPFNLLEVRDGGFDEVRIAVDDNHLAEISIPLEETSDLALLAGTAREHLDPGDRLEIRPDLEQWLRSAVGTLGRGYVVLIDYGDTEPQIWADRPAGTLVTYRNEQLGFDPLQDPGELDITAHVNFSALFRAAMKLDVTALPLVTQREWLKSLGLDDVEEQLKQEQRVAEDRSDSGTALGILAERSRAAALAYRGGLGDLKVLVGARGAPIPQSFEILAAKGKTGAS